MSWININAKIGDKIKTCVVNMNRVIYIQYDFSTNIDAVHFYFTREERLSFRKAESGPGLKIDDTGMTELLSALDKLKIPTAI